MRPIATIGDMVFFPGCKCNPVKTYPIITGHPDDLEIGIPIATIGSLIAAPIAPLPMVVVGTPLSLDLSIPTSRIGDAALCVKCGPGIIISGKPTRLEAP